MSLKKIIVRLTVVMVMSKVYLTANSNLWDKPTPNPLKNTKYVGPYSFDFLITPLQHFEVDTSIEEVKLNKNGQILIVTIKNRKFAYIYATSSAGLWDDYYFSTTLYLPFAPTTVDILKKTENTSIFLMADGYSSYVLGVTDILNYQNIDFNEQTYESSDVTVARISPKGDIFALGFDNGILRVKSTPKSTEENHGFMFEVKTNFAKIYDISFSNDGKVIAVCGMGRAIELYEAETGHKFGEIKTPIEIYRLKFLNESLIVSIDRAGFLRVYDFLTLTLLKQFPIGKPEVKDFDITLDGKIAAVVDKDGYKLNVWSFDENFSNAKLVDSLTFEKSPVFTVSVSNSVVQEAYLVAIGGHEKLGDKFVSLYLVEPKRYEKLSNFYQKTFPESSTIRADIFHLSPKEIELKALSIGIETFDDPNVAYLYYAQEDAIGMFNLFLNQTEFFKSVECEMLLNTDATFEEVVNSISNLLDSADENDAVYIFMATHGILLKSDSSNTSGYYLILHDSYLDNIFEKSPKDIDPYEYRLLSSDWLSQKLLESKAGFVAIIIDACNRAPGASRTLAEKTHNAGSWALMVRNFQKVTNERRVVFISSSENEVAPEDPNLRHGVFTYFLLRGAEGEADADGDGVVSLAEIWNYVRYNVKLYSEQHNYLQHPNLFGKIDLKKRFPFVVLFKN